MCCYIMKDGMDQCHVGFLRHNCTKCHTYDSALIQVVGVISSEDTDATRTTKFHSFHGWADAAVIRVTKHYLLSSDEQHSRKRKKIII